MTRIDAWIARCRGRYVHVTREEPGVWVAEIGDPTGVVAVGRSTVSSASAIADALRRRAASWRPAAKG